MFFTCVDGMDLFVLQNEHIYRHLNSMRISQAFFSVWYSMCNQVHIIHDTFSFYSQHFRKKAFGLLQSFHTGRA